jgi:hypothetical protein
MEEVLKMKKQSILNLEEIKALQKQGFTIRSLSLTFHIPYATLYRALHRQSDKSRREWLKRKKNGCYFCSGKKSVIHHIDCDRDNNSESNLVELCKKCHLRLHRRIYDELIKVGKVINKNNEKGKA